MFRRKKVYETELLLTFPDVLYFVCEETSTPIVALLTSGSVIRAFFFFLDYFEYF